MERYEPGTTAYIIENNRIVSEVVVIASSGDFVTVKFLSKGAALRLRKSKVFPTREEAQKHIVR